MHPSTTPFTLNFTLVKVSVKYRAKRNVGVPLLREGTTLVCRDRAARDRLTSRMLADVEDFLPLRGRLLRERRQRWIG